MADDNRNYADECGDHGGRNSSGGPCGRPAGWGTDFGDGKCRHHRGTSPDGSSHAGNQNAVGNDGGNPNAETAAITHGVNADPFNLYRHLSDEAEEHVNALIEGYCRILGYDDADPRRERVKRACIHIYQSNSGENQILEDGLSESQTIGVSETGQPIVRDDGHHLHGDTLKRDREARQLLRTLGAFDDPESQKADALGEMNVTINRTRVTEENVDEYV